MKSTDKAVKVSAQTTRTKFDGVLLTIRSGKSFFEVTQAIERRMQRFHIPKLMEYVTHGDRAGVEAYVDSVSRPLQFSIFWDFEQGSVMRLAGIPIESKFYLDRQLQISAVSCVPRKHPDQRPLEPTKVAGE